MPVDTASSPGLLGTLGLIVVNGQVASGLCLWLPTPVDPSQGPLGFAVDSAKVELLGSLGRRSGRSRAQPSFNAPLPVAM